MARLKNFIDKYDLIIFDMDGVITSENGYWDSAALTVYELLNSKEYFGQRTLDLNNVFSNLKMIRKVVFSDNKIISLLKNKGVNSNWDLAYLVFCASIINHTKNPDDIYKYLEKLSDNILNDYEKIGITTAIVLGKPSEYCIRGGKLWQTVVDIFQKWYLGSKNVPALIDKEAPLLDKEKTRLVLKTLSSEKRLGYGTGRVAEEIETPLTNWDFLKYFSQDACVSYDYVVRSEKALLNHGITSTLTKPHPYMFLQAAFGTQYDALKLYNNDYSCDKINKTLIVGDAGADILAAHSAGFDFCAVLTGVSGKDAKAYFESQNSEYILDSIMNFIEE